MIYHTQGLAILHNVKKVYFGCVFHKKRNFSILVVRIVSPVTDDICILCTRYVDTLFHVWTCK